MTGSSPQTESPPSLQVARASRAPVSSQSSVSDDSWILRGEQVDPLARTAQLSLATSASITPPLANLPPFDPIGESDALRRSSRLTYLPQQQEGRPSLASDSASFYPSAGGPNLMQYGPGDENWRSRLPEAAPRTYPDLSRTVGPRLTSTPVGPHFSSMPMPLISPERLSDVVQEQPQRTLPPPRLSTARERQQNRRGLSRPEVTQRPSSAAPPTPGRASQEGSVPPLDRSESEAINALAGLAAREGRSETPKRPGQGPYPR